MKKWLLFVLLIFCVGEISAQKVLYSNKKSNLNKSTLTSPIFLESGGAPSAVLNDKKEIICISNAPNSQSLLYAVKIDSNGNFLWKNVQIRISMGELDGTSGEVRILPRPDGGTYFIYDFYEYRGFEDGDNRTLTIYYARYPHIQYVDALGNIKWGETGKRLTNMVVDFQGGADMQQISLAPDGNIMVYWTWFNEHRKAGVANEFGTYVQKLDPVSGEFKFGDSGKKLFNFIASSIKESPNGNIYMSQDPYVFQNGGDSVACFNSFAEKQWQLPLGTDPLMATNDYGELILINGTGQDLRAALFTGNGSTIWTDKIISTSVKYLVPTMITNWMNNSWIFKMGEVGNSVYCVDRNGTMLWGESGKAAYPSILNATPIDDESVLVAFKKPDPTGNYDDLYLQKLNKNGDAVWNSDGIKIIENVMTDIIILPDKKGGAYLIIDAFGIYFQKVDKDGNLGNVTSVKSNEMNNNISVLTSVTCYPNPSNGIQTFNIKTKSGDELNEIILYDILGREVRKLNLVNPSGGEMFLRWDGKNNNGVYTAPGVYFYNMRTKNNINLSGKLLRIK